MSSSFPTYFLWNTVFFKNVVIVFHFFCGTLYSFLQMSSSFSTFFYRPLHFLTNVVLLPQLPSIFQRDPTPTLGVESDGNYPHYPTTVCFWRDPTPTSEAESEWQLPSLPQLPSVFRETPPPPLKVNLNGKGNYP